MEGLNGKEGSENLDAQMQRSMAMMESDQAHCEVAPRREFILVFENDAVANEMKALLDEFEIYWYKLADACYIVETVGGNMSVWRLLVTIDSLFVSEITGRGGFQRSAEMIIENRKITGFNDAKSELEYVIKQYREQGVALPKLKKEKELSKSMNKELKIRRYVKEN